MKIILEKKEFDISVVSRAEIRKVSKEELLVIEQEKNGENISIEISRGLEDVLNEYAYEIGCRLPAPRIYKFDLPVYDHDENPENWQYKRYGKHSFQIKKYATEDDDISIQWNCEIKYNSENGRTKKVEKLCYLTEIISVLKELCAIPEKKVNRGRLLWNLLMDTGLAHSFKEIQQDVLPVYKEYESIFDRISRRKEVKKYFLEKHEKKSILCIEFTDSSTRKYLEGCCQFDIFEKEKEIKNALNEYRNYQKKVENSNNAGEKDVEYAIKWFLAAYDGYAISIIGDCESKHRVNCIQLYKPDFLDEPQEMDHIIVCPAGVVIIETKHWKGNVNIRPDGKWIRKADDESAIIGVDSPKFQMRRHEVLMQKILPGVQVHSLLCFSNFKDYPIITVDLLEDALTNLCAKGTYTTEEIDYMVATIEAHKLRKA